MQSSRLQPTGCRHRPATCPNLQAIYRPCRNPLFRPGASGPAPGSAKAQLRPVLQAQGQSGCPEAEKPRLELDRSSRRPWLTTFCKRAVNAVAGCTTAAFGFVSHAICQDSGIPRSNVVCQSSFDREGSTSGAGLPERDDKATLPDGSGGSGSPGPEAQAALQDEPRDLSKAMVDNLQLEQPSKGDDAVMAAFQRLVDRTARPGVKDVLMLNQAKLVKEEVTSEEALQGLTLEELRAFQLSKAAATALKEAFPSSTATGPPQVPLAAVPAGAGEGALAAVTSADISMLASIKAWAEVVVKMGALLHATQAELNEMSEADRQAADNMRTQRFIPMPDGLCDILPSVLTDSFYNRHVYDEFLNLIDSLDAGGRRTWALVITGDPGIGKSTLALRLILKLAAHRKKLIYKFVDEENNDALTQIYVDFSDPADIKVDLANDPADVKRFLATYYRDREVFRLLDGKTPAGQYKGKARTIVFSSPAAKKWNEFTKTARNSTNKKESATVAWMPWWTADELVQAAVRLGQIPSMEQRQQVEDRFKDLGGIARRVLGDERPSHAILEQLQGELSFSLAQQLVRSYDDGTLAELSHRFVHAVVTDKFQFVCWELASAAIAEMVHGKFDNLQWYQLSELFATMGSNPKAAQMLGQLFEQRAHVLGRRGVPAVLGITLAADSVGYLPRAGTSATAASPGQHTNAAPGAAASSSSPAAASGTTASSAAATPPKAQGKGKRGKSQTPSSSSSSSNSSPSAASGTTAAAATPPKAEGKGKGGKPHPPSSSGSGVSAVLQDLDKQQQDHVRALIAHAYNKPHRRQLDLGGPLYPNMYLEPVHATQGSWDAVLWDDEAGFLIVQHTSNVKHGLILKYIKEMLERIKQADPESSHPVHIVFAVPEHPPELFPAFAAQKLTEGQRTLQWEEVPQEVLNIHMWKIKLPMTPTKLADASSALQAATEQQTKERVRFMQICDMTLKQLEDELRQQHQTVKGQNKVQVRNRLLRLEDLLPYGVGTFADEGSDSSSTAGSDAGTVASSKEDSREAGELDAGNAASAAVGREEGSNRQQQQR